MMLRVMGKHVRLFSFKQTWSIKRHISYAEQIKIHRAARTNA